MLRSGARPVAVAPTLTGLDLVWETLTEALDAVQAGKLSLIVNDDPAGIRQVTQTGARCVRPSTGSFVRSVLVCVCVGRGLVVCACVGLLFVLGSGSVLFSFAFIAVVLAAPPAADRHYLMLSHARSCSFFGSARERPPRVS